MTLSEAYNILGLEKNCTLEEIKSAYRKLVLKTHPDKGGKQEDFIKIQSAYEILCNFNKTDINTDDFEIPIPEELRKVIDEIVLDFNRIYSQAENLCNKKFDLFYNDMNNYIKVATRDQLKNFNQTFSEKWNLFIKNLFKEFNMNCNSLIKKYDGWFSKSMEVFFEEIYLSELKNYKNNPRFYLYLFLLFIASLIASFITFGTSNMIAILIIIISMPINLFLTKFIWKIDCDSRKKKVEDLQILDIKPFKVSDNFDFSSSNTLKEGHKLKKDGLSTGGSAGILVALASGKNFFGDALIGGAIGYAVGTVIDRFMNPTEKMRAQLQNEFENLMKLAHQEILEYVISSHQELLENLAKKVTDNYENRIKETIKLLKSGI